MKYGTAHFVINNGGRYSIQYNNPEIQSILIDDLYNDNLKENGFTCMYFFTKPEELEFTTKETINYVVCLMEVDPAREWVRNNTNMQEVEIGKFEISPESEFMGEIIPAKYLFIN